MDAEFNGATVHQPASHKDEGHSSVPETFAALRRFARSRPEIERCELCGIGLAPEHPHLLESGSRHITCSCDACAILFCGKERAKFLRVPRRILQLECFGFDDLDWEAMLLPINLAFFLRGPDGRTTAFYPSPAGAMSSLIDLPSWDVLFGSESALLSLEPEVQALLVNRIGAQAMHFVVPIDECYRLVGLIRTKWHGLSGGPDVWKAVADFFTSLEGRATRVGKGPHA
jgi:hypothetical protein